ncbi:hypothetical protein K435DRAFT_771878 [Dendrothele bispora CBS 962.96]|uniref:Uncharacterized protein n=1 Tax=Dendrothele bispora (strain CBS 962.96) TaxID=1314807 RepID=A0A4S8MY44_DENBC|nr:hypothetical protein K435DRAFT_771878 [Dendrothele bispora CBS 962.96]
MAEDDNIDTEALQAQIDLSMSFTHELVSSWIKPTQKSRSSYAQDLETEIKDYMRRPPRLGVGAAIPESTSSMPREIARLKGQLIRKNNKRAREDDEETKAQSSSDEGESKASSIRKRVKHDPFAGIHGKEKKKNVVPNSRPADTSVHDHVQKADSTATTQGSRSNPFSVVEVKASSPEVTLSISSATTERDESGTNLSPDMKKTETPKKAENGSSTSMPRPIPVTPKSSSPKLSRPPISVLNLDGPVGHDDSGDDEAQASPSKKKRKRRKKKKHAHPVSEG